MCNLKCVNQNLSSTSRHAENTAQKLVCIISQNLLMVLQNLNLQSLGYGIFEEVVSIVKRLLGALLSLLNELHDMLKYEKLMSKVVGFLQSFADAFEPLEYCTTIHLKFLCMYFKKVLQIYRLHPDYILEYIEFTPKKLPMFCALEQLFFSKREHQEAQLCILLLMKLKIQELQYKIVVEYQLCSNVMSVMEITLSDKDCKFTDYCKFLIHIVAEITSNDFKLQQIQRISQFFIGLFEDCDINNQIRLAEVLALSIMNCDLEDYAAIFESTQCQNFLESLFFNGTSFSALVVLNLCNCVANSTLKYRLYTKNIPVSLKNLIGLPNALLDRIRIISMLTSNDNYCESISTYSQMLSEIDIEFGLCDLWFLLDSEKLFTKLVIRSLKLYFENPTETNQIVHCIFQGLFKYDHHTILNPLLDEHVIHGNSKFSETVLNLYDRKKSYNDAIYKVQLNSYGTLKSLQSKSEFKTALKTRDLVDSETLSANIDHFGQLVHKIYFNARIHKMQMKGTC